MAKYIMLVIYVYPNPVLSGYRAKGEFLREMAAIKKMASKQQSPLKMFSWFRLFFLVIVVYFIYVIAGQQLELMYIRKEARQVNSALEQAAAENKRLNAEKNDLNTLTHIEKLAREELGMVKPGEIPYIPSKKQEK